jgi:bifunctional non-homologous end joining protein LigD
MKTKSENETVSLAFNDLAQGGTSDKVYHLSLEQNGKGFTVTAQYGRRGSALAVDIKTKNGAVSYDDARKIFDRVLREKKNKGYVEAGAKAPAAQVQPPAANDFEAKPQELLEEVTNETTLAHLLASDQYWMQDKSDGHSRGAVKTRGGLLYGLNKLGKEVPLPAEIVAELKRIELDSFQIDAELVGDKLVCRDLLIRNRDISSATYEDRFIALVAAFNVCPEFKHLRIVETWAGHATKLAAYAQSSAQRREGVVFKLKSAPHRGGRNGQHKKFKFVKTLSAIAGKPRATGKDSVEIFLLDATSRCRVGTVSLIGKVKVDEGDVVEVAYLYAFPSKKLCQARFLRPRVDVHIGECTTEQLVFKREEAV